ncbi:hypothetical protein CDAR_98431 [Caerostris darwini]|uniref:Uncharacterized protein n=1 Tax=Caerostris darwini TaxID=1538125 RepID=A0AAV4UFZ3_9ARAC|nr:hypothetical protein CDAR_98431 [Caerostris darwini]
MTVPSLYNNCLQKTFDCLMEEFWRGCPENPFERVPSSIVNDLFRLLKSPEIPMKVRHLEMYNPPSMAKMSPDVLTIPPNFTKLHLLISSGQLTYVDLSLRGSCMCDWDSVDFKKLFKLMTPEACKNIRFLALPFEFRCLMCNVIPELVKRCPKLEYLKTYQYFDLAVLKSCNNLRSVRIHNLDPNYVPFPWKPADFQLFLKKLEIFDVFRKNEFSLLDEKMAQILLWGPKLISVGQIDTASALDYIYRSADSAALAAPQTALKRCYWGRKPLWNEFTDEYFYPRAYKSRYPEIIRNAALSCPMLEELIINVIHPDCLQQLRHLKRLDVMCVMFGASGEDCFTAFLDLLRDFGHQLRHLSISASYKIPVNAVCERCPNLLSLEIYRTGTVSEIVDTCENLKHLKTLFVCEIDTEGLLFLLQNCVGLEELFIYNAACLNDEILNEILMKNRFLDLKDLHIQQSALSDNGCQTFLKSAENLEKFIVELTSEHDSIRKSPNYSSTPHALECLFDEYRF